MPDTNRTEADLISIFPSGTAAISAQDVRDLVESLFTLAAKGDIAGIDVAGLRQALSVSGNDGWVLTEDAASTLGWKWAAAGGHTEDHDHDGSPTQQLLAANTHGSASADTHHAQSHGNGDHTTAFTDDTTVNNHIADTGDAHDASAISILDAANDFTATDVEGALAELQSDAEAHIAAADPHTGYVKENDANYIDLTDGGATTLHTHAGGAATFDYGKSLAMASGSFIN